MIFNVNNNNNKPEQNFVKIDKCIFEINNVITKICQENVPLWKGKGNDSGVGLASYPGNGCPFDCYITGSCRLYFLHV